MFNNLKLKDFIQLIIILMITVVGSYYYVNNQARTNLWQKTYPVRASLSNKALSCSTNAPKWMANIIQYQTLHNNAPSNQIAYIDKKGVLHHCENGYIDDYPIISEKLSESARFRYASVTKLWTADAILDLIKQGKLTLNTRLVDVLTQVKNPKDERVNDITIAMLLSHRAGFDRYTAMGANDMFGIGEEICPNHLQKLNKITLNFTPDSKTSYSNLGYCLLGEVIATLYQKPYVQVIHENYHLADSSLRFIDNQKMIDEVSYNHVEEGLTGIADIFTFFDYKSLASSAGLSGNAVDLAKQVQMMQRKTVPNITSMNEKHSCQLTLQDEMECYGYAMMAYQTDKKSVYYRDGALPGLSSLVAVDDEGQIVTLLSNGRASQDVSGNQLKLAIYQHLQ